jgi:hypothetical protein
LEHREGNFRGYGDSALYYQCWLPAQNPEAVLVISHGLADTRRYSNVVDYFGPKGYAVLRSRLTAPWQIEGLRGQLGAVFPIHRSPRTFIGWCPDEQPR